ncbi:DUF4432 family protein [bacterium]|nr:DUF4432 family protein [bacterium]
MSTAFFSHLGTRKVHEVSAGLSTYAGARLLTLEDGVERGSRVIEMRSGGGLDVEVTVDRSGDIGRLTLDGQVISWHGPAGLPSAWLMDREGDNGQGFLRGYGGFLNTCGLDHIRQPEDDTIECTNQESLASVHHPLHGKGTFQPCVIRGYGLVDDAEKPCVFCEAEFVQGMAFISALRLRRRIELPVGSQTLTICDTVKNVGNNPATHMLLYHFNLGFPLVARDTRVDFGKDECVWYSEAHDPTALFPEPTAHDTNKISVFRHITEEACMTIKSPLTGLSMQFTYPSSQLSHCQMLQMTAPGIYGIGIEPCTAGSRTRKLAREADEMIFLQPGEERKYDIKLTIDKTDNKK